MRVLLNATPRELATISGDMSFYRDLAAADRETDYRLVAPNLAAARALPKLAERIAAHLPPSAARRRLFQAARRRPVAGTRAPRAGAPDAPDVILSHITLPPAGAIPVIWSSQGLSPPDYYAAAGPVGYADVVAVYEAYSREAAALLVWTQSGAERLRAEARLAAPVVVLPPILPRRAVAAAPPREADIHVLFVGRDARRKGLYELVAAFERLAAGRPAAPARWRLDVIGAPPADLTARLAALGGAHLHRDASDAAVAGLMARADLLALPTKAETYGYVLIEAMAQGCALLTTDAPPMNALVRNGENGRVAAAGDAEALTAVLGEMLGDPARLAAMGAASRARWGAEFAPEAVAPRYRALYGAVAARRGLDASGGGPAAAQAAARSAVSGGLSLPERAA